jgi:uncharacterized membrane protein
MHNHKKIGVIILVAVLVLGGVFFSLLNQLSQASQQLGCTPSAECVPVEQQMSMSHIAIGLLGGLLGFSVFLIFFSKSEEMILQRLEQQKQQKDQDEVHSAMMQVMTSNEQNIFSIIKKQPGITQNTLRLKSDLSKASVSQILSSFEGKKLIKREPKGKSFAVYILEAV